MASARIASLNVGLGAEHHSQRGPGAEPLVGVRKLKVFCQFSYKKVAKG